MPDNAPPLLPVVAILNMNPAQPQVIEQQRGQRMLAMDIEEEPARERFNLRAHAVANEQSIEVRDEPGCPLGQPRLQLRPLGLQML
jgi:hypothetical protein